jgi:hypothetical protein
MSPVNVIMGIALGFSIAGYFLLEKNQNAKFKRKIHPYFIITMAVVFAVYMHHIAPNWRLWVTFYPPVVLIVLWSLLTTRFCLQCGKTNYNQLKRSSKCINCGNRFDAGPWGTLLVIFLNQKIEK